MSNKRKLAKFLEEVSDWRWDQYVKAELDLTYSTSQSIVFSLVRACAMENLSAIKTALGRLDGKVATPIQILMPKVFYLYPNAEEAIPIIEIPDDSPQNLMLVDGREIDPAMTAPTKGFRETLDRMAEQPRHFPQTIIDSQEQVEKFIRSKGRAPLKIPMVKSVVAAHILKMAQERNLDAINEVFDQMDGKLVETIKVVGEDMYIYQFGKIAPAGAIKNEDGVYQIEAKIVQDIWRQKLDQGKGDILEA